MSPAKARVLRFAILALSGLVPAATCSAGKLVVILRRSGTWQLQDAEKVTIDGKNKVRQGGAGALQVTSDSYKAMAPVVIGLSPMRVHRAGYLSIKPGGAAWLPVAPDGASIKTQTTVAALWAASAVQIQADAKAKLVEYKSDDVFAILPGQSAADAAVDFLASESNFMGVGEKDANDAFEERMSMLVAVSSIVNGPALAKLNAMLLTAMDTALQQSNSGLDRYAAVLHGLKYVSVSEKAFPTDAQQKKSRDALMAKKAALDQRVAILRAFGAGEQWDSLIDKYGDFEQYDNAFDEVRKLRERSFQESFASHLTDAKKFQSEKNWLPCMREVETALKRNPNDKETQNLQEICRIGDPNPVPRHEEVIPVATLRLIARSLALAESYMNDGKLTEAEAEIASAEAMSKTYPAIVYTRAELYRSRKEYPKAIEALNRYDKMVSADTDVARGEGLRAKILYEMRSGKENLKAGIVKAMADGDYSQAMKSAGDGLQIDPDDVDFLYYAGLNSAILRKEAESAVFLRKFLAVSLPTTEAKRRAEVGEILPIVSTPRKAAQGPVNWYSGAGCPAGLMYCPDDLMPNVHPNSVRSSRKQTTTFAWSGNVLSTVRTESQEKGDADYAVYFDYYGGGKGGVRRIDKDNFTDKDTTAGPKFTADGPVGTGKGAYVALLSNPVVNPWMVEKLTAKRVATIVAGNPWFQPFVWAGVYEFLAEYDADGRVVSAKMIHSKNNQNLTLDFTWDGYRLMSIAEHGGNYRRDMKYSGDKIISESIRTGSKSVEIKYKYQGDRLVEADCDDDPSLDSRSRHVSFY